MTSDLATGRPAAGPGWLGNAGRRPLALAALALLLIALVLAGADWLHQRFTHVEENDAQTAGEVTTIASRLDGWLVSRPVMEGDHVVKGQILGVLDSRDAQLRLAALVGDLAAHDAQIRQATIQHETSQQTNDARIADARAQLAAAQADVAAAAPRAESARADFARDGKLVGQGIISRQDWDHARSAQEQADAALAQARAQLAGRQADLAQATAQLGQVSVLEQQIVRLQGERESLAARAEQVRQEIADRTLRAPFDGIVDRTFIHPGDYVQAGQWLMMLHDPSDIWVEANVKETEIDRLKVGQPVAVSVDAYPGTTLKGRVLRIGNAATNQFALLPSPNPSGNFTKITQRVPIRIALDNPPRPLQPGLMVEVSIDVSD